MSGHKTKAAISIGIFDGVHLGHQKILNRLVQDARKMHLKSIVVTFEPHPQKVLHPYKDIPLLTSLQHRIYLIKNLGVDECHVIQFTKSFSKKNGEDFIKMLIEEFGLKEMVIGIDFLFGYGRKGDIQVLKRLSGLYNFQLVVLSPLRLRGEVVSSTKIRHYIEEGDLKSASRMLGRPVSILGTVIEGKKVGRDLGFPTANIDPHHEAIPPSGVYAVDARFGKKIYQGILNIGRRPTIFRDREPVIELHIFHFHKDIYGRDVEVIFRKKIRDEQRFPSIEALKEQIAKDIRLAL